MNLGGSLSLGSGGAHEKGELPVYYCNPLMVPVVLG